MKHLVIATLGLGLLAFGGHAAAANCTIKLNGDDRMQFDQKEVTVSASCQTINIELTHTGKLPVAAMGHNVVVAAAGDVSAINSAGAKAGAAAGYLPQGDARVLGATGMIGGGAWSDRVGRKTAMLVPAIVVLILARIWRVSVTE